MLNEPKKTPLDLSQVRRVTQAPVPIKPVCGFGSSIIPNESRREKKESIPLDDHWMNLAHVVRSSGKNVLTVVNWVFESNLVNFDPHTNLPFDPNSPIARSTKSEWFTRSKFTKSSQLSSFEEQEKELSGIPVRKSDLNRFKNQHP
jgi:hypothetical protein